MASQHLVPGLPHVFQSLPPSHAPPCTPCLKGRLQRKIFFLVVVGNYSRYTTVFPLAKKSDMTSTLIRWLLATKTTRGRRASCLHSGRGDSSQHNGVAERRIGLVMEITCTSMIHARAPHFLWPYAVRYTAHHLNLWPRVSRPRASPTSIGTGSPGVASEFRVWGCLGLVCDTSSDRLSARAIPCVFLGFPVDSPDYIFYHPPPHRTPVEVSPPLFLAPTPPPAPVPPVHPTPPGPAPFGVSNATPLPLVARLVPSPSPQSSSRSPQCPLALPRQVAVDSGGVGVRGAGVGGASTEGASSEGARAEGAGAEGTGTRGARSGGAGVEGAGNGVAYSEGAGAGTGGASSGGVIARGAISEETRAGGTATTAPAPPPHRYPTRHQALLQLEREEQERLVQERLELEQRQQ
ncbi:unnamed protein product [Closterium sp. NIES-53]